MFSNPHAADAQNRQRLRILAAARELLRTQGHDGLSMRRLAKALGCSPGTLYLYFRDKDELFESLAGDSFGRLNQALTGLIDRHQDSDQVLLLRKGLYTYVEFGLRHPEDYQLAFLRHTSAQAVYAAHPLFEKIRYMVARCVRERAIQVGIDIDCTAQALWAAAHGVTSLLIHKPPAPAQRAKVIEQVIENAVGALVSRVGASLAVGA